MPTIINRRNFLRRAGAALTMERILSRPLLVGAVALGRVYREPAFNISKAESHLY